MIHVERPKETLICPEEVYSRLPSHVNHEQEYNRSEKCNAELSRAYSKRKLHSETSKRFDANMKNKIK
jgi:sRNA-binding carbon storage regulator CsrA